MYACVCMYVSDVILSEHGTLPLLVEELSTLTGTISIGRPVTGTKEAVECNRRGYCGMFLLKSFSVFHWKAFIPGAKTRGVPKFWTQGKNCMFFCDISVREADWRSRARGTKALRRRREH
jgi:hypothetical protein